MSILCFVDRSVCFASSISPESKSPRPVSIRVLRLTLSTTKNEFGYRTAFTVLHVHFGTNVFRIQVRLKKTTRMVFADSPAQFHLLNDVTR